MKPKKSDLSYFADGLLTRFLANTTAGEDAWRVIAEGTHGTGVILTAHLESTLHQLRAAGYSVRKGKREKTSEKEADDLLAALTDEAK